MNRTQLALYAAMSRSTAIVEITRPVYVVHCNSKAFPFIQASEAYALKVHLETVGLDATITIQESI